MNVIEISIKNKIAKTTSTIEYVCGNSDYLIRFSFDEEWDAFDAKTARIINGDGEYYDVVFTGTECAMPIIEDAYAIKVGVYAGNLHTTTPAYVSAKKSILCGTGTPAEPAPDVYGQIMEKVDEACKASDSAVQKAVESAEQAAEGASSAAQSADKAKESEENADTSARNAAAYATAAQDSAESAKQSQEAAAASAQSIADALPSKLTEPSTGLAVGKYFRVAALDENGHAVLEAADLPSAPVQDVQVNGASVVADGVANVPYATNVIPGVARYDSSMGITWQTNGVAYIAEANTRNIDNRSKYKPIVPSNLDYAVKAALCDGKGAAWTEAEQAAARERMGVPGDYELIASSELSEDAKVNMLIDTDIYGNSFCLSGIIVNIKLMPIEASTNIYIYKNNEEGALEKIVHGSSYFDSTEQVFITFKVSKYGEKYLKSMSLFKQSTYIYDGSNARIGYSERTCNITGTTNDVSSALITKIQISSGNTCPAGCRFDVYGVRA